MICNCGKKGRKGKKQQTEKVEYAKRCEERKKEERHFDAGLVFISLPLPHISSSHIFLTYLHISLSVGWTAPVLLFVYLCLFFLWPTISQTMTAVIPTNKKQKKTTTHKHRTRENSVGKVGSRRYLSFSRPPLTVIIGRDCPTRTLSYSWRYLYSVVP